jgi:hypothetical protein
LRCYSAGVCWAGYGSFITALTAAALVVSDVSPSVRDVTKEAYRHCCVGLMVRDVRIGDTQALQTGRNFECLVACVYGVL